MTEQISKAKRKFLEITFEKGHRTNKTALEEARCVKRVKKSFVKPSPPQGHPLEEHNKINKISNQGLPTPLSFVPSTFIVIIEDLCNHVRKPKGK